MGGLVGSMDGATVSNSEAAVDIYCPNGQDVVAGGLVGSVNNADGANSTIHSSMSMSNIHNNVLHSGVTEILGGLVGSANFGYIQNSFVNAKISNSVSGTGTSNTIYVGGLVGSNGTTGSTIGAAMNNCYVTLRDFVNSSLTPDNFGSLVGKNNANETYSDNVDGCYVLEGIKSVPASGQNPAINYSYILNGNNCNSTCGTFKSAASSDTYGYLYDDNRVTREANTSKPDTTMFVILNNWAETNSTSGTHYARWARPTILGVNNDLPVLLLCNYGKDNNNMFDKKKIGSGDFRSLATYEGSYVLQYGGPIRDDNHDLNPMLARMTATDNVYVYGDVTETAVAFGTTKPANIAIHEDVAILHPGALAGGGSKEDPVPVYVGVTFDNPSREALDYYGNVLHRDWHMLSTPLANAPLGMDYRIGGVDQNTSGVWSAPGSSSNLYVYNYWDEDPYDLPTYKFYAASEKDGYFPSQGLNPGGVQGTGPNVYEYPYDFFCWYEPDWQWINFKRNGVSHWHYDIDGDPEHYHPHIDYNATSYALSDFVNKNEENLVVGKGYMMSIDKDTYLQSHGELNNSDVTVGLYNTPSWAAWGYGPAYVGNNLIGNPYHAYLDFDKTDLGSYYVYDADDLHGVGGGEGSNPHVNSTKGGYLIYASGGSENGYYAPQYLHPHQGFFIKADANATSFTFTENMCVTREQAGGGSEFRDWKPTYPLVNLFAYDKDGRGDVVVVEFNRPEYGGGLKAKALRNGNHQIYARHEEEDFGAFFAKMGTERVPIRFKSYENEDAVYTLKWDTQNGNFHSMYLIDNLTGVTTDMLRESRYSFMTSPHDYLTRFYIVFDVTDVDEFVDDEDDSFIYFNGSGWVVEGQGHLDVVDVTGHVLYSTELVDNTTEVNLNQYAKGVYLMRLTTQHTQRTQRIVNIK